MQIIDDSEIIRRVIDGEIDQFEQLVSRYENLVFSIVSRRIPGHDCDSVAQEVFLKLFNALPKISSVKIKNWLTTVSIRSCYDYWRNHSREQRFRVNDNGNQENDWFEMIAAVNALAEFNAATRRGDNIALVEQIMRRLAEQDRMLIELIYFEQLPLREVAKALQWSLSKVKVRAMRARLKLRHLIGSLLKAEQHEE